MAQRTRSAGDTLSEATIEGPGHRWRCGAVEVHLADPGQSSSGSGLAGGAKGRGVLAGDVCVGFQTSRWRLLRRGPGLRVDSLVADPSSSPPYGPHGRNFEAGFDYNLLILGYFCGILLILRRKTVRESGREFRFFQQRRREVSDRRAASVRGAAVGTPGNAGMEHEEGVADLHPHGIESHLRTPGARHLLRELLRDRRSSPPLVRGLRGK